MSRLTTPKFDLKSNLPIWEDLYERIAYVAEGVYGDVFTAKEKATGKIVAIKRLRPLNDDDGYKLARKEVGILETMNHPNVISILNVVRNEEQVRYIVMDCMKCDLKRLMKENDSWKMSCAEVKGYMKQILAGVQYCHAGKILHRDLKPENILLSDRGVVKIADFGLCRKLNARETESDKHQGYTNPMQTRYYRSPEIFLGARDYSYPSDVWALGCIFVELLLGCVFMAGKYDTRLETNDETDQLTLIWRICGTPFENDWPNVVKCPRWNELRPTFTKTRDFYSYLHTNNKTSRKHYFTKLAVELIDKMMHLDPLKRISCKDALAHSYFVADAPEPLQAEALPRRAVPNYACLGNNNKKLKT